MKPRIRPQDFAFTVEARSSKWDVYHFRKNRQWGTLAFRQHHGRWEIGILQKGKLQRHEAINILEKAGETERCEVCQGRGTWQDYGTLTVCGTCRGTGFVTV